MYWVPKTKIGKLSFWFVISGFLIIFFLNVIAGLWQVNDVCDAEGRCYPSPGSLGANQTFVFMVGAIPSLFALVSIVVAGITSIIAILKYRDFAFLLFLSAMIGVLGIFFVLGEFLVPH